MKPCWNAEQVRLTMDPDATQTLEHRFLATHQPMRMILRDGYSGAGNTVTQEQFLEAFMALKDHAFVPVLGFAGTGKSHLIRWLKAQIPSTKERLVLLIPKLKTNLKDVIELILDAMTDPHFEEYRRRLRSATQDLTLPQAREQLLHRIAEAIGKANHPDLPAGSNLEYFAEELPSLFNDPFFRKLLNQEGGIIHQLAIHILGHQDTVERRDVRREFTPADFPVQLKDFRHASRDAQNIFQALGGDQDGLLVEAIDWVNKNLDTAIGKMLDLGGDSVLRLMREVRESLHRDNVELVFLIEDFAKQQGIDRALLEALLARPDQLGQKPLCRVKFALACTDGYFDNLGDTVLQRVTLSIWFDFGRVSEDSLMSPAERNRLAASYLNAARLSDAELIAWHANVLSDSDLKVPSACQGCNVQKACHEGFGAVDGFGLFPFTVTALDRMQAKVNRGEFNTRLFLKDLLRPVLDKGEKEIPAGKFPSIEVQKDFGLELDVKVKGQLERQDPKDHVRRTTLVSLWGPGDRLVDFPGFLHEAFSIPKLGQEVWAVGPLAGGAPPVTATRGVPAESVSTQVLTEETGTASVTMTSQNSTGGASPSEVPENEPPTRSVGTKTPVAPPAPTALESNLEEVEAWSNQNTPLTQSLREKLGIMLIYSIKERIDWDAELLLEKQFISLTDNTPFKRTSLSFLPTGPGNQRLGDIQLNIPMSSSELTLASIALKGLLLFDHHGHWKFPDGAYYPGIFASQLELWSQSVLKQIRALNGEDYDPVPAAAEVLAIGARLKGIPLSESNLVSDLFDAVFRREETESRKEASRPLPKLGPVSDEWMRLMAAYDQAERAILDTLKCRVACTKGGSDNLQVVDAAKLVPVFTDLVVDWKPKSNLPSVETTELRPLIQIRRLLETEWDSALAAERARLVRWFDWAQVELGADPDLLSLAEGLQATVAAANHVGVVRGASHQDVIRALGDLPKLPVKEVMQSLKCLETAPPRGELLNLLCQEEIAAVITGIQPISEVLTRFLEFTEDHVDSQLQNLAGTDGQSIENLVREIEVDVTALRQIVISLEGDLL